MKHVGLLPPVGPHVVHGGLGQKEEGVGIGEIWGGDNHKVIVLKGVDRPVGRVGLVGRLDEFHGEPLLVIADQEHRGAPVDQLARIVGHRGDVGQRDSQLCDTEVPIRGGPILLGPATDERMRGAEHGHPIRGAHGGGEPVVEQVHVIHFVGVVERGAKRPCGITDHLFLLIVESFLGGAESQLVGIRLVA